MPIHGLRLGLSILLAAFMLQSAFCITGNEAIDRSLLGDPIYDALEDELYGEQEAEHQAPPQEQAAQDQTAGQEQQPPPEPQGAFLPPAAPAELPAQPAAPALESPAASPEAHAPVALSVDYPSVIPPDGKMYYGWIPFTDAGGDVTHKKIEITWGTTPMQGCDKCGVEIEGASTAGKVRIGFY